jgi:hypothetical protein
MSTAVAPAPVQKAEGELGVIFNAKRLEASEGIWRFDDKDWALFAQLCDPILMSELLFEDKQNRAYHGCYHVMDYQYPLFRVRDPYETHPCARSVGKTESIKARAVSHVFKRQGDDMLITAPELIHLMPLCDAIEQRIMDTRITAEFLDKRNQKTGFTHKPFQADFIDGTKLVGRIPKLSGTGVKGMHVPDLVIDEGQDYPEKGYIEVHETVMKDRVDHGRPAGLHLPDVRRPLWRTRRPLLQTVHFRRVQGHADHRDDAAGLERGREGEGRRDLRRHPVAGLQAQHPG